MAPSKSKKQPPKGHAVSTNPYADLPKNEKGKYTSWRSGTPAADTLKVLVRGGSLDGMTAGQVQKHDMYKVFDLWENNCFSSALSNVRKQYKKEVETARGAGSDAVRTHSTLGAIDEEQTYNSAEDGDYEDLSDAVSAMSIGDHTYDTRTVGFRSAAVPGLGRTRSATKQSEEPTSGSSKRPFIHGNKFIELPFVLDQWYDSAGNSRISIQLQLLAGGEQWKKIIVRVSTLQKELVIYVPISEYLLRADWALETFFLGSQVGPLTDTEKEAYQLVMSVHTKTAARKVAVSKILERSVLDGEGKYYKQRIPLPRKVQFDFATKEYDKFFWGKKTVTYPDGSSFMFIELIGAKVDGYRAAEDVSLAANHVAAYPFQSAAPAFVAAAQDAHMDVAPPPVPRAQPPAPPVPPPAQPPAPPAESQALVLHDGYTNTDQQRRAAKRSCAAKRKPSMQAEEQQQQQQHSPARAPPIRNLMVPSPPPNQRRSTMDDDWTLETVQTSVTGPHPRLPQEEEQQETIVVSSLQFAANNPKY